MPNSIKSFEDIKENASYFSARIDAKSIVTTQVSLGVLINNITFFQILGKCPGPIQLSKVKVVRLHIEEAHSFSIFSFTNLRNTTKLSRIASFWKSWDRMLFTFYWHRERFLLNLVWGPNCSSISPNSEIKLININIFKASKYFEWRPWFAILTKYDISDANQTKNWEGVSSYWEEIYCFFSSKFAFIIKNDIMKNVLPIHL